MTVYLVAEVEGTHNFVLWRHFLPSSCTFSADSSFGRVLAEVFGNDTTSSLHEEEERCERTFWRIRIV